MKESETELVLISQGLDHPEVDVLVNSVDQNVKEFERNGGSIIVPPFDIPIGRCAVISDPWKNEFVVLDFSKGLLKTDKDKNVMP